MIRRVAALVLVVLATFVMPGQAAVPEGPRLAVVTHDAQYTTELITIGPAGEAPQQLIVQPASDRPSWSADGSLLALAATGDQWKGSVVAVTNAEGNGLRAYRRAVLDGGGDPVISPDGRSAVYARSKLVKVLPGRESYLFKASIWSLDLKSGAVRRLTPWRLATYLMPSSFSPDGSSLAATTYDQRGFRAVAIDLRTGRFSPLAREASEPTYSPDGSAVAFVSWKNWRSSWVDDGSPPINELRVAQVGAFPRSRLLLRSRKLLGWPSWDPSGSRLSFTSSQVVENGYSSPEEGNKLMAINSDRTCLTRFLTDPDLTIYGSAWQPGPGREAGRISC